MSDNYFNFKRTGLRAAIFAGVLAAALFLALPALAEEQAGDGKESGRGTQRGQSAPPVTAFVIDVDLRDGGRPGVHGRIGADVMSSRALVEWNGDESSVFLSAREGYLDHVFDAVQDQAVIEPAYRDFLARAVYRPSPDRRR